MPESARFAKVIPAAIVVSLMLIAGVAGYFFGMAQRSPDEDAGNTSDSTPELKTAYPSSLLESSLSFHVSEEQNATTGELVQYMRIQGQVVNEGSLNVTSGLKLQVHYYYERDETSHRGFYVFDVGEVWEAQQIIVGYVRLEGGASESVDWKFEALRAYPSEWWRLIQVENATFYYGFPGEYIDEQYRAHPCSALSVGIELAPTPDFYTEFSVTILNEWPTSTAGGLTYVKGYVYNDGPVRGSCMVRWQFNDSREWTDEHEQFDMPEFQSDSLERWYCNPWIEMDDSAIRLNHWVITLW